MKYSEIMEKQPVKVSVIGKGKNNYYRIKFPNLQVPINVNEELYQKMLRSQEYRFVDRTTKQTELP